jgi:hypothetical protein
LRLTQGARESQKIIVYRARHRVAKFLVSSRISGKGRSQTNSDFVGIHGPVSTLGSKVVDELGFL